MSDLLDQAIQSYQDEAQQRVRLQPSPEIPSPATVGAPPAPTQPEGEGQPKKSLMDVAGDAVKGVGKWLSKPTGEQFQDVSKGLAGAEAGIVRAPSQLVGGVLDLNADAGKFVDDNIKNPWVRKYAQAVTLPQQLALAARDKLNRGASLADVLSDRAGLGQVGNPGVNQFAAQAGAIAATLPFGGEGGAEGAAPILKQAGQLLMNSGKVGLASAAVMDPRAGRISDLLSSAGIHNQVVDYLASDPSDPDIVARFKNGIEGALGNAVLEPVFGLAKGIAGALKGDTAAVAEAGDALRPLADSAAPETTIGQATPEEAARDALDRTFATQRTQAAREEAALQQQAIEDGKEPPKATNDQEQLPQGTRHGDDPTADPKAALANDANAALEQAGAAERVSPDTMEVTPDGRVKVDPKTKAAMDDQGMGRAFAASNESVADHVLFKEEDAQGGSRVVGKMAREDVQAFADKTADLRDAVLDGKNPEETLNTRASPTERQVTVAQLGSSYDTPAVLRALSDEVPKTTISHEETMRAAQATANAMGLDPNDFLQWVHSWVGRNGDLATGMATAQLQWTRMGKDLDDLVGADLVNAPKDVVNDAAAKIHNMMTFTSAFAEMKAGAARALNVLALPDADTYLANVGRYAKEELPPSAPGSMPPLPRTPEELQQWVDLWDATKGDPKMRQDFLQGLLTTPKKWLYLRNSFANFFTASLVSGPQTLMRDLVGPALLGGLRTLERTAGGYAAAVGNTLMGDTQAATEALAAASAAPQAYARTLGDVADAFKYAVAKTKGELPSGPATGYSAPGMGAGGLHGESPIDFNVRGVPQALIDAATAQSPGVTGAAPYLLGNLINKWPQAIQALHGGINEFALRLSYLGEIRAQAYLDVAKAQAEGGMSPDLADAFVRGRLTNAVDPLGSATDPAAFDSAQRTTFTKQVGVEGQNSRAFAQFVQTVRQNIPEARYILPIFNVPANAIGETLRRIPILNTLFKETQDELSGSAGALAQAEAYGRMMSGAALMTGGFAMARSGMLTGAGPTDPHARALWLTTHQPYSIRIGDTWASYNRMDAVGPLLGIVGSVFDHSVYHGVDSPEATYAGMAALAQYFKDQASLQGISDLLSFGGSPQESQGFLTHLVNGVASGFVPNFITQLGRNNLDAQARIARNPFEAILNKLPLASRTLDPMRNVLGEDVYKPQGALFNTLPVTLSPANSYAKDPVVDELGRLYEQTGYAPGVPSPGAGKGHFDMRDVKLEDGMSLYSHLMGARQTSQVDGQTLRQALSDTINSQEYNEAVDGTGHSANSFNDMGQANRGAMLQSVFDKFSRQAKQDVAQASPTASRWLAVAAAKNTDNAALRAYSAHDLVNTPGLLHSLGIPIGDYEDKIKGQ